MAGRGLDRPAETVAEFARRWPTDYNTAGTRWGRKTQGDLQRALNPLIASLYGHAPLAELTRGEARRIVGDAPARYIVTYRTMFEDAKRDGLIDFNPFDGLVPPQGPGRRDIAVLSEAELGQLIRCAGDVESGVPGMIALLGFAGMRPGEVFALRYTDVGADEISVEISFNGVEYKRPKNGQRRRIVLPPQADVWLPSSRLNYPCPCAEESEPDPDCLVCDGDGLARWLFTDSYGDPFRRRTFDRVWATAREAFERKLFLPDPDRLRELHEKRGGKRMAPYELRHTAATIMLARLEGVADKYELVAKQLGHTDRGVLVRQLYGHPDEDRDRARLKEAFWT
jgi:integrase